MPEPMTTPATPGRDGAPHEAVTEAALDAAMAAAPDRHLGYFGGWEPAISRRDMRKVLEAAARHLAAAERERILRAATDLSRSFQGDLRDLLRQEGGT